MDDKTHPSSIVHREASARLWGELKARLSSFNTNQIISSASIIIFVIALLSIGSSNAALLPFILPTVVVLIILFACVVVGGFIRSLFIKPEDEFAPVMTKFMHQHRAIEISGLPRNAITKDFIYDVSAAVFVENPAPIGLIEGDAADDKSIKLLGEKERTEIQEKERKELEAHKQHILEQIKSAKKDAPALGAKQATEAKSQP